MFLHLLRHLIGRSQLIFIAAVLLAAAPGPARGAAPPPTSVCAVTTPNPQMYGSFGWSVAVASSRGSAPEVIVGAPWETVDGTYAQGRVYVFSATTGALLHTLTTPAPQMNAFFGWSVAAADVDGDGVADIIVGADGRWTKMINLTLPGQVYVFSGATGELLYTLSSLYPEPGGGFGGSVSVADADGDGKPDIIVGAPYETVGAYARQGRTYVFSGMTGVLLYALTSPNPGFDAHFGAALAAADVDGSGATELIVGAPGERVGGNFEQGRVYSFSGSTGALLATLTTPNPQQNGHFGASVLAVRRAANSVDIVVGAPWEKADGNFEQGRAYVFSGATGTLINTLTTPHPQGTAVFGQSLATLDVRGKPEVVVGASGENSFSGTAYVFTGTAGALLDELTSTNPPLASFGWSLAAANTHGKGQRVLVAGAPGEIVGGNWSQGRAYIFSTGGGRQLSCPGS